MGKINILEALGKTTEQIKEYVDNFDITEKVNAYLGENLAYSNVKDYGAVGDGVTDDSAAINNALADSKVKQLYFPSGIYLCKTNIIIDHDIDIIGDGKEKSVILFKDSDFTLSYNWGMIRTKPVATGETLNIDRIYVEKMGFKYAIETETPYTDETKEQCFFLLTGGKDINIRDSAFIIDSPNKIPTRTSAFWVQKYQGEIDNIYIDNCYMQNYSGNYAGGALWIKNDNTYIASDIAKITLTNNTINSCGWDEAIGIWTNDDDNTKIIDINMVGNTIVGKMHDEDGGEDHNLISVYKKCKNIYVKNNTFAFDGKFSKAGSLIKAFDFDGDVNSIFEGNIFNVSVSNGYTESTQQILFQLENTEFTNNIVNATYDENCYLRLFRACADSKVSNNVFNIEMQGSTRELYLIASYTNENATRKQNAIYSGNVFNVAVNDAVTSVTANMTLMQNYFFLDNIFNFTGNAVNTATVMLRNNTITEEFTHTFKGNKLIYSNNNSKNNIGYMNLPYNNVVANYMNIICNDNMLIGHNYYEAGIAINKLKSLIFTNNIGYIILNNVKATADILDTLADNYVYKGNAVIGDTNICE